MASFDWDDLRYVLALARQGSLSAAARALAVTQPTVGRRIEALERNLGARLFARRSSAGYAPTAAGKQLVAHAERMEHEVLAAERGLGGRDAGLQGCVRVTASEWLAARVLAPALASLAHRHPGLRLELLADHRHLNLARREADLALRPQRFQHQSVYQRKLGGLAFALYASDSYLERHGLPDAATRLQGHVLIAMSDEVGDVTRPWLDAVARDARIALVCNGREPMAAMAAAGAGLACLPRVLGDATPGLRALPTSPAPPAPALWIGVHRDARSIPRVRAALAHLVQSVPPLLPA